MPAAGHLSIGSVIGHSRSTAELFHPRQLADEAIAHRHDPCDGICSVCIGGNHLYGVYPSHCVVYRELDIYW